MNNVVVAIPAFQPDKKIIEIVSDLLRKDINRIIVVNDGSEKKSNDIFKKLEKKGVVLINHSINLGKGEALKTAFKYIISNFKDISSIITVDADGQHLASDVEKIALCASRDYGNLYIGTRKFNPDVPLRSLVGNVITKYLFAIFTGKSVKDTQSGLRAIPIEFAKKMIDAKSSRYEFELEMLHLAIKNKIAIVQVPIETVYEKNNPTSHFNPIIDSVRIYKVLFKYSLVSFLSALLDYALFLLFFHFLGSIFISVFSARFIAVFFNFALSKKFVFLSRKKIIELFPKYIALVSINPLISGSIIYILSSLMFIPVSIGKIIAEIILFIFNFIIQKRFIF